MAEQPNLQIAAGLNNAAGLTAIEDALTLTSSARGIVQSWGNYTFGLKKFRADGTLYHTGYPSTKWIFPVLGFTQYYTLNNTYCGGAFGFSGLVTIKTNSVRHSVYDNHNATLLVPHPSELQVGTSRTHYLNVTLTFIRLEAI